MPRKKARNPLKRKQVDFDTAPDIFINPKKVPKKKSARPKNDNQDEEELGGAMPKAFKRLMNWSQKMQGNKKETDKEEERGRTRTREVSKPAPVPAPATTNLRILPGERMSDFSRRVDEALPLVKARKGSPSRADKKKARKRARAEAEAKKNKKSDDEEEEEEEKVPKGKREPSPDPWAHLESKKPKFGDVVDRPPELNLPSKLLRNVPKSAGSLARRAILEDERNRVIESYRALMEQKRGGGGGE